MKMRIFEVGLNALRNAMREIYTYKKSFLALMSMYESSNRGVKKNGLIS